MRFHRSRSRSVPGAGEGHVFTWLASYAEAETGARAKRLGLWAKSKTAPQPPWAFRHILERQREKAKNAAGNPAPKPTAAPRIVKPASTVKANVRRH
jgi:hypothetical protein